MDISVKWESDNLIAVDSWRNRRENVGGGYYVHYPGLDSEGKR